MPRPCRSAWCTSRCVQWKRPVHVSALTCTKKTNIAPFRRSHCKKTGPLRQAHRGGLQRRARRSGVGVRHIRARAPREAQGHWAQIRGQVPRPRPRRHRRGPAAAARGDIHHVPAGPPQHRSSRGGVRVPLGDIPRPGALPGGGAIRPPRRAAGLPLHRGAVRATDQADALLRAVHPLEGDHPPRLEARKLPLQQPRRRLRAEDDRLRPEQALQVRRGPERGGGDAVHGRARGHSWELRREVRRLGHW